MTLLDLPQPQPIIGARLIIGSTNIRATGEGSPYSHPAIPPLWLAYLPATACDLARKLKLQRTIMQTRLQTQRKLGRCHPTYPNGPYKAVWQRT